jgi:hypothetical protein
VAEGARLESVYTGNRIVGSNPTPSARTPFADVRLRSYKSIKLFILSVLLVFIRSARSSKFGDSRANCWYLCWYLDIAPTEIPTDVKTQFRLGLP